MFEIRPYGNLRWILGKLPSNQPWTVIGCLSPEDRCLASAKEILRFSPSSKCVFLELAPSKSSKTYDDVSTKIEYNRQRSLIELAGSIEFHRNRPLPLHSDDHHDVIEAVQELVDQCRGKVIVDISAMPKRWFFPLIRELVYSDAVETLVATYAKPEGYGKKLSHDAEPWEPLPGYLHSSPGNAESIAIIGVGYDPMNLHAFLDGKSTSRISLKLFLPFPSLHPGFRSNWEFIRSLVADWKGETPEIIRVPTDDVSLAFDCLKQQSMKGRVESLSLSPFGPKPLSLAMCLLGIARERDGEPEWQTEIGYTQPNAYAADYSKGVAKNDSIPVVNAYCLRLRGRCLYSIDG